MICAATSLADAAEIAGIVAAILSLATLVFVAYQLRLGNHERHAQAMTLRSTATMHFQERFKESQEARHHLFVEFPLHESLVATMSELRPDSPPDPGFPTWVSVDELDPDQRGGKAGHQRV